MPYCDLAIWRGFQAVSRNILCELSRKWLEGGWGRWKLYKCKATDRPALAQPITVEITSFLSNCNHPFSGPFLGSQNVSHNACPDSLPRWQWVITDQPLQRHPVNAHFQSPKRLILNLSKPKISSSRAHEAVKTQIVFLEVFHACKLQ